MTRKKPTPAWREFERVVAMIEASAAPRGASVTSPDRIRDLVTGEMRGVDASIRLRVGSVDVLITVECQRRNRKANDMWIEQLATKRQKLGAARTIAVCAKGFTRAAHVTALHHGIDLRTLSEITLSDVDEWFLTGCVSHVMPLAANVRCAVRLEGHPEYIDVADCDEKLFFHGRVVSPFPAIDLWAFHEMAHPRRFMSLPRDGSVNRVEYVIDAKSPELVPIPPGVTDRTVLPLTIELGGSRKVVASVELSADVSIELVSFDAADGKHHQYDADDRRIAQHSRFEGRAFGLPVTIDLASQGGRVAGFAEFPSGARLELATSDLVRERCAFCGTPAEMHLSAVLPDFLVPADVSAKERFLCEGCGPMFETWDAYAAQVWQQLPSDLTGTAHGAFSLGKIDGGVLRLWLLSLIWRMGQSAALNIVELGDHARVIHGLLLASDPGDPSQYPTVCVALSHEGQRIELFYPPRWNSGGEQPVLSVVLQGVLFNFLVGTDVSDKPQLLTDERWVFPIADWRTVDFLVEAAVAARVATESQGPKPQSAT